MNNPLVSVIVPTKNSSEFLEKCLQSVKDQTYKNIEIIVLIPKEDRGFTNLAKKLGFKLLYCSEGKSASRNIGVNNSRGEYLLHIDDDMHLSKDLISECINLVLKHNYKAVAIPEFEEKSSGLYNKIRIFEKIISSLDPQIESSRFVEKELFNKVGQIDERLDPIDEGDLKEKLKEKEIPYTLATKSHIFIDSKNRMSSLERRWVDMYKRGQKMPLFKVLHPKSNQLNPTERAKTFIMNWRILVGNPFLSACLVLIKAVDIVVLYAGSLNVRKVDRVTILELKNKIVFESESDTYQQEFFENTIGARYIDSKEKELVKSYLKNFDKDSFIKILDVGPGGGRWSELMLNYFNNSEVIACDLSEGMVNNLQIRFKKDSRFRALTGDMQSLPFQNNMFDLVISIRAIKYAANQEKVFDEIHRILRPGGATIIELPYLNFIYRIIRGLNIFGKVSEYARRINLRTSKEILTSLRRSGLNVESCSVAFAIPATVFKSVNQRGLVKILQAVDHLLPKYVFGRSIFLVLSRKE